MIWTYYDTETGRVMGKRSGKGALPARGTMGMIEGDYSAGFWINPETLEPAALETMALTVSGNAITGLPAGATASHKGQSVVAAGDCLSVCVAYDEAVTVLVEHPRHYPEAVTVGCVGGIAAVHPDVLTIEQDVIDLRAKAYPSIGDQLDAIWKGGADAEAMLTRVQAVKASLPK